MIETLVKTFQYEFWSLERYVKVIIEGSKTLPSENLTPIVVLLSHITLAQRIWLERLTNTTSKYEPWTPLSLEETTLLLSNNKKDFAEFVSSLDEKLLNVELNYHNTKGVSFSTKVSDILTHLSHHSAYHRGQLSQLLKANSIPFPPTDYILFIREQN
jgi:uncharacterized damage-inducible protein DinB